MLSWVVKSLPEGISKLIMWHNQDFQQLASTVVRARPMPAAKRIPEIW